MDGVLGCFQDIPTSCFSSGTQWLLLVCDKEHHLAQDPTAVGVHMQFQLLFEQFLVLGRIHSGVRRNEIQTSSATTRHGTPNHLARREFHCRYNISFVETLNQWLSNEHVARYKLLHGAFIRKQHFLPLGERLMAMTSGKVQSLFLHHWCQV